MKAFKNFSLFLFIFSSFILNEVYASSSLLWGGGVSRVLRQPFVRGITVHLRDFTENPLNDMERDVRRQNPEGIKVLYDRMMNEKNSSEELLIHATRQLLFSHEPKLIIPTYSHIEQIQTPDQNKLTLEKIKLLFVLEIIQLMEVYPENVGKILQGSTVQKRVRLFSFFEEGNKPKDLLSCEISQAYINQQRERVTNTLFSVPRELQINALYNFMRYETVKHIMMDVLGNHPITWSEKLLAPSNLLVRAIKILASLSEPKPKILTTIRFNRYFGQSLMDEDRKKTLTDVLIIALAQELGMTDTEIRSILVDDELNWKGRITKFVEDLRLPLPILLTRNSEFNR